MKTKYRKRKCNKSKTRRNKRRLHYKNRKSRKVLRGGVVTPFSEASGIFGNISNTINNLIGTVSISPPPPTPSTYNPVLPLDKNLTEDLVTLDPTKSLSEIIKFN